MLIEYVNKIRPYLKAIINNLNKFDTRKIQFFFSQDHNEECVMHLKIDNIEIMINVKAVEDIEKIFQIISV